MEAEETPEVEVEIGGGAGEAVPAPAAEASTSSNVNGSESVDAAGSAASAAAGVGQKKRESDGQQQQQQRGTQDRDLPPSKRARTCVSGVDAGRQRRLFGSITKTLSRFQEDTKKDTEAVSLCAPSSHCQLCILMLHTLTEQTKSCRRRKAGGQTARGESGARSQVWKGESSTQPEDGYFTERGREEFLHCDRASPFVGQLRCCCN